MTGQEILALAIERAGDDAAELARLLHLRDLTEADALGPQVRRWARDDGPKIPSDVVVRALDYMDAINWDALNREPALEARTRSRRRRASTQQTTLRRKRGEGSQDRPG